jgi:hypothetical protein
MLPTGPTFRSRHRFGIIATTRELTAKERYTFDLEQVFGPPYSKD